MRHTSPPYARVVFLGVTYLLVLPLVGMAQSICASVPAAASGGVPFGDVVAGQTYSYQASGCIQRSLEPNFADPDGNQSIDGCTTFTGKAIAPETYTCPGLNGFALVGKINGASCFQLGKSGTFTASSSGQLVLYCNDDIYGDNSGAWDVCISPGQQGMCTSVPGADPSGVVIGNVVFGQTYSYQASGCITFQVGPGAHSADPDGFQYQNTCATLTGTQFVSAAGFPCTGLLNWSLVGKINGGPCIQLGKSGTFTATASGPLALYFNDDIYGDNSGAWDVCIGVPPADSDGDGVPVDQDQCPNTPPGAIVDSHGCSIDQLVPCAGPASGGTWRNHGEYVSAIVKASTQFLADGLITSVQRGAIVSQAARSPCSKK